LHLTQCLPNTVDFYIVRSIRNFFWTTCLWPQDVDARDERGHDAGTSAPFALLKHTPRASRRARSAAARAYLR